MELMCWLDLSFVVCVDLSFVVCSSVRRINLFWHFCFVPSPP